MGDVLTNIQEGQSGLDIFSIRSSGLDYFASGIGGAIASSPGNFVYTLVMGAAGNVVADTLKGNMNCIHDFMESVAWGAGANGVGYGVSKVLALAKVSQIDDMTRTSQKKVFEYACFS